MDKIAINKFVSPLTEVEKIELLQILNQGITTDKVVGISNSLNRDRRIECPHCQSVEIYGHGQYRGRSRYKCRDCHKTFNDHTGTAISGIKKISEFHSYLNLLIESVSIRKAAKKLDINMATIFAWRHKLLSSLSEINGCKFNGIVECDDKQLNISEKGNKHLDREAYKRPSDRQTKRGISSDKISVMVATDRHKNPLMKVAKRGRIDVKSIEQTIGNHVDTENVLCSDAHQSIISWATSKNLEHHSFIASKKQHVKDKCFHIQHVNSIDNRFERWQKQFYGFSTKYLQNYLNWFVFLEKIKAVYDKLAELARIMFGNKKAILAFQNIKSEYLNLINPHFAKT